jgi:hypothetical protein
VKIAVCLLTCGREAETALTLKTFAMYADRPGFIKLHADEAGQLPTNRLMAAEDGFALVHAPEERQGALTAMRVMWREAVKRGATHILHLENDQEFVARLPDREIFEGVECVRLYGARKMRGDGPRAFAGEHIMGTKTPIAWRPWVDGWEHGIAHWGGQASITRADVLLPAIERVETFKDLSLHLTCVTTVRPLQNITFHTCERTTEGGVF